MASRALTLSSPTKLARPAKKSDSLLHWDELKGTGVKSTDNDSRPL
jgi:hypothetical protein